MPNLRATENLPIANPAPVIPTLNELGGFMSFDSEELFQLLAKKDWIVISKLMYRNSKIIGSNPIMSHAIQLFESEFFRETDELMPGERKKAYEFPGLIIDLNQHSFSRSFVDTFVDKKISLLTELKSDSLFNYAVSNQHRESAKRVIREFQSNKPEVVADAKRQHVSVKATETSSGKPKTINLFKSNMEQCFFEAVRDAFPTYHPYPNIALSTILDFKAIDNQLSPQEKEYFFKALIDSVVFDTRHGYEPKYFIELDSSFHDSDRARHNDKMKDNIFRAANAKLIRIRPHKSSEISTAKFKELILEIMRGM
ncbi:DUF2726 domain-containing protein [Iodobacter sp. CM08]|uniref:DUF2726 domain-containing protein n=1 Tax=Iodobacter sp. CM08 TaxID=3085902 RepID=UPI0029820186|nr:DUF2726 domain-containing protein [Iodobacter sp. CM08]MDW5418943.1 DUF2726 domain-containing protein [Iodobacter sp. CM08]